MSAYPLIVVEGIDASGKKTHTTRLVEYLKSVGFENAVRMEFPNYENVTGKAIRGHLGEEWWAQPKAGHPNPIIDELVFQCLMTTNRYEELGKLKDALELGPVVLDRYWPSGYAYGKANGLPDAFLLAIHAGLPAPTCCIFIDMPVQDSWARRPDRRDRYENQAEMMEKVREAYGILFADQAKLGGYWRVLPVTAESEVFDVQESLRYLIDPILPKIPSPRVSGVHKRT